MLKTCGLRSTVLTVAVAALALILTATLKQTIDLMVTQRHTQRGGKTVDKCEFFKRLDFTTSHS